jgi:hypothetical protein
MNPTAAQNFADDAIFITRRTAAFQVCSFDTNNLCNFKRILAAANVKVRYIFAGFRSDYRLRNQT